MTPPEPTISIVLPTFRRPQTLARTLRHLAEQSVPAHAFEVIVCEDGRTEQTREVIDQARATHPIVIEFIQHDGHRGPGWTQNEGIRAARAELVLLLADDIWLAPGAVQAHLDMHARFGGRRTVAVLGRAVQSPELSGSVFIRHWDPFNFAKLEGQQALPYHYFWGCNISFNRAFVVENGMFLEHRGRAADGRGGGGAAHEDVELGYRLHSQGLELFYAEQAWGHHFHPYSLEQAMSRYYERGVNFDQFRQYVPDASILVQNHVLTRDTWREYAAAVQAAPASEGLEGHLWWHVCRQAIFATLFNSVTVPAVWRPLLLAAERSPMLAACMSKGLYRAFLYFHFMRGIRDATRHYREALT